MIEWTRMDKALASKIDWLRAYMGGGQAFIVMAQSSAELYAKIPYWVASA